MENKFSLFSFRRVLFHGVSDGLRYNGPMGRANNITESEWPIMRVLWDKGTATASEIVETVMGERDVSMRTIKTLLRRLIAKRAVAFDVDADDLRVYHYRPLIPRDAAVRQKSDNFLTQIYQNNIGDLLAHFVKSDDISEDEIRKLQELLKAKSGKGRQ
jgi:predicted transcriptional regulator